MGVAIAGWEAAAIKVAAIGPYDTTAVSRPLQDSKLSKVLSVRRTYELGNAFHGEGPPPLQVQMYVVDG